MISKVSKAIQTIRDRLTRPLHIEFNLTDYCNLNCKGCSHYSPVAEKEFEAIEELENSMRKISSVKNSHLIEEVFLIGGETLLYPQIKEAMVMARKFFPWARIIIFTNGLLIPKLDDEFWNICKETETEMAITRYPVKFDYDKVESICREHGIPTEIFGDRGEENSFFKLPLDPEKKQNKRLSHFRCCAFGCVTVDHGRIFPCSQAACVGHLNRRFGTDFKWEKDDYIEVDNIKDAKEIIRLRLKPIPFCGYCKHQEYTPYGPSSRSLSEWT